MIRNLLYSICLHLGFLAALYFGVKNIDYSDKDEILKGVSIGVKLDKPKEEKKEEPKEVKKDQEKKFKDPQKEKKKKNEKPKKKQNKKLPENSIAKKKDINLPTVKEEKIVKKEVVNDKIDEDPPISIRKIYQNDIYTDSIDNLDLAAVYTRSIKNHLNFCFSQILEGQDDSLEKVDEIEIIFDMTKGGVIKFDFSRNVDDKLLKDQKYANYQKIIDKINNSTGNCAIFRNLPADKYDIWREFKVLFTNKK